MPADWLTRQPGFLGAARLVPPHRRPLTDEEEESMLGNLSSSGASGLNYLASALDKPGRAIRGLLGGKPSELLAAIPFSDSAGITDPKNAVSGRNLTDMAGITTRGDKGWGAWGAGLGAEMLLDPLNALTFGGAATTKLGTALGKAGLTKGLTRKQMLQGFQNTASGLAASGKSAAQVEHAINAGKRVATEAMEQAAAKEGLSIGRDAPLAGLMGIGLPFAKPTVVLGTGKRAQEVAGYADKASEFLQYGNPVGRYLGAYFSPDKGGATQDYIQKAFRRSGTPAYEAAQAQMRGEVYDVTSGINELLESTGAPESDLIASLRRGSEGVPAPNQAAAALDLKAWPLARQMREFGTRQLDQASQIGGPTVDASDRWVQYVPRVATSVDRPGVQSRPSTVSPAATASNIQRKDPLRNVPGGTQAIDDLAMAYSGQPAATIRDDVFDRLLREAVAVHRQITPGIYDEVSAKADDLAKSLSGMSPEYAEKGIPFFSPKLADVVKLRGERHAREMKGTSAILEAIASVAKPAQDLGAGGVSLRQAMRQIGAGAGGLKTKRGASGAFEGAGVEVLKKLARSGQGPVTDTMLRSPKRLRRALDTWAVPQSAIAELTSNWNRWVNPSGVDQPLKVADSLTNLFKNMAYSIWVPSHVRNLFGAGVTNLTGLGTGVRPNAAALRVMRDTATADEIRQFMKDLPAGLSDQEAREHLRRSAYVNAGIFSGNTSAQDIAGAGLSAKDLWTSGSKINPPTPGEGRTGTSGSLVGDMLGLFREGILGKRDPTSGERVTSPLWIGKQAGLYDRAAGDLRKGDGWSVLNAGRIAGTNVEDFSRLAGYLTALGKGTDPTEAGRLVNKLHFDYGNTTDFERNVMRRLLPFYTFMSRNLPLQAENLLTRPATIASQLRPISALRGEYTPEWIGAGVAVPMGENQDGSTRYLSQLGLPIEEAFERFKFRGGLPDVKGTAMALAAGVNPYPKGLIEYLTDTQFFSGRRLSDLKPTRAGSLGGALGDENAGLLTQIIANSPATRFATSLDKALDDRKPLLARGLNLLSGVRITDVDTEKARAIEARRVLEGILAKNPKIANITNFYVRPDAEPLAGGEVDMMRLLEELKERARAAARDRRREGLASL